MDPFKATQARKRREREAAVDRLQEEARRRGQVADRAFWSMVYDFEMAPLTTNRRQLEEMGVDLPPPPSLADDECAEKVREIAEALARLHIYMLHTDHLSDRQLYERLVTAVLDEEVRDLPALDGVREYLDFLVDCSEEEAEMYDRELPYRRDATLPKPPEFVA